MDEYKIRISTLQTIEDEGKEDKIELITKGTVRRLGDSFIVDYDESDITETEGCRTRLKISPDRMVMTKIGVVSSKMEFKQGFKYTNPYVTPYGTFDVEYHTVRFVNNLSAEGKGTVEADYRITLGETAEGFNQLRVEIF